MAVWSGVCDVQLVAAREAISIIIALPGEGVWKRRGCSRGRQGCHGRCGSTETCLPRESGPSTPVHHCYLPSLPLLRLPSVSAIHLHHRATSPGSGLVRAAR
jgi:hypothetical protein